MGAWEYKPLPRAIRIHVRSRFLFQAQKPFSNLSVTKHANFKLDHKSSADFWECLIPTLLTAKVTFIALNRTLQGNYRRMAVCLFLQFFFFLNGKHLKLKVVAFGIKSTVLPMFPPSHQLSVSMVFSDRIITSSSYLVFPFMIVNLIFSLLSGGLSGNFYQCHFSNTHVLFLPSFLLIFLQTDNSRFWQKLCLI